MNFRLVTVGKVNERYLQLGMNDYLSRLKPYARVEVIEIPEARKPGKAEAVQHQILEKEAEAIRRNLREGAHLVVLAEEGNKMTSLDLARYLETLSVEGKSKIDFVIGGHLGLAPEMKRNAHLFLSLSSLTFPHLLARLILLEQLYRSFKIIRGEPYHR